MSMMANFLIIACTQANELATHPEQVASYIYSQEVQESKNLIEIGKDWHAIHYMLTGTADEGKEPYTSVTLGGTPINDDVGYGPARLLQNDKVNEINNALQLISTPQFMTKFDPDELNKYEIYPTFWTNEDSESVQEAFETTKHVYSEAVKQNACIIQFLN